VIESIHRAGTPVGGLHWPHGDATERAGDRESMLDRRLAKAFGVERWTLSVER